MKNKSTDNKSTQKAAGGRWAGHVLLSDEEKAERKKAADARYRRSQAGKASSTKAVKRWRARNPEKAREYARTSSRTYYQQHREEVLAKHKARRQAGNTTDGK